MILRPVNDTGDILPVLSTSALLSGARAVARLVEDRLNLYAGDWWENPAWGNRVIEMLRESRLTEADAQAMATYLTSYIRKTDGVEDVREVRFAVEDRQFSYSCTVLTENGPADIRYVL
jgi:hypothetical protein